MSLTLDAFVIDYGYKPDIKIVDTVHIILTQYCFIFGIGQNSVQLVENFRVREKLRFKTGCALRTVRKILIRNTDARLFCFFFHFSKWKDRISK